ncbi:MAG TPA: alpha/beta hydrolase [Sphingomicrobium sp.]|nr:alpha/beta hydrolase [Sphingomicrobium sp.]
MAVFAASMVGSAAHGQDDRMVALPTPAQQDAIVLGTGPLPGATSRESWYRQYGKSFARNVTVATLTPFLPPPARATGTAVIVAPGGGFRSLSMENEGSDVARALAAKGVAAFVLKYRLVPTPPDFNTFQQAMAAMFAGAARPAGRPPSRIEANLAPQLADSRAAFAVVRSHASQWHVNPNRVGMVGFSAGAMLTLQTALREPEVKPAFIGIVYGPLDPVTVPANAPPMFVALAADDPLFGGRGMGLIQSWISAKRPVEFHLYEQGGHGFGMYPKPTTSTGWFNAFVSWLGMHAFLKPEQ